MIAASSPLYRLAFASRSTRSTLPPASHSTITTRMPASAALAGLVPWAEEGIRQTSRWSSPRLSW